MGKVILQSNKVKSVFLLQGFSEPLVQYHTLWTFKWLVSRGRSSKTCLSIETSRSVSCSNNLPLNTGEGIISVFYIGSVYIDLKTVVEFSSTLRYFCLS